MYQELIDICHFLAYTGQQRGSRSMPFERTNKIEQRFDQAVRLISKTKVNARELAMALGVSRPTVHRIITELKRRGYPIRSIRDDQGWRYELTSESSSVSLLGRKVNPTR